MVIGYYVITYSPFGPPPRRRVRVPPLFTNHHWTLSEQTLAAANNSFAMNPFLSHPTYVLVLLLILFPIIQASSFLSDALVRKGQVQEVLGRHPTKHAECQNSKVRKHDTSN